MTSHIPVFGISCLGNLQIPSSLTCFQALDCAHLSSMRMLCILLSVALDTSPRQRTPQYDPTDYGTSIHAGRVFASIRGI